MNKIFYFSLLGLFYFAVLVFISGCKTDINALNERGETKLHLAADKEQRSRRNSCFNKSRC